jgi:hypothetical protein
MWLLVAREPRQDAPQWIGRKGLAAIDAVMWPALFTLLIYLSPHPLGVVGLVAAVAAQAASLVRLQQAIWNNHRYWFTTWRLGSVAFALVLVGAAIKALT